MPIRVADMARNERTMEVEFLDETARVTYRPLAYTPELEAALDEAGARASGRIIKFLEAVLISWEVLDEDGQELPPTKEVMEKLPLDFLSAVSNAITKDKLAEGARKNSGDGSPQAAS